MRISDNPLDISSFSTEIVLDSLGATNYSQIFEQSGEYFVFYRVNSKNWAYRSSKAD